MRVLNKKRGWKEFVALVIMVMMIVSYCSIVGDVFRSAIYNRETEGYTVTGTTPEVNAGFEYLQGFTCESDGLSYINVIFGTYDINNRCIMYAEFMDSDKNLIQEWELQTGIDVYDFDKYYTFNLDNVIRDSAGKTYYLKITSNALYGDGFTILISSEGEGLSSSGVDFGSSMCYQLGYEYTWADLLGSKTEFMKTLNTIVFAVSPIVLIVYIFYVCKNSNKTSFIIASLMCAAFMYILNRVINNTDAILYGLHTFELDSFMDFFNSMKYGLHPYENKVIYPPFINVLYWLLSYLFSDTSIGFGMSYVRETQVGRILFVVRMILYTVFLVHLICKYKKSEKDASFIFAGIVLFSYPFLYCYERGNVVLLSFILSFAFVYLYDSNRFRDRFLSYFFLALAINIKLYPVVFAALILQGKHKKELVHVIWMSSVLFVVSFSLLGGYDAFLMLLNRLIEIDGFKNRGLGFKLGWSAAFGFLEEMLETTDWIESFEGTFKIIFLTLGALIGVFVKFKHKWMNLAVLSLLIIMIPSVSYEYVAMFMLIPLISYLDEKVSHGANYLWLIAFVVIFMLPADWHFEFLDKFSDDTYALTSSVFIQNIALIIMSLFVWIAGIIKLIAGAKSLILRKKGVAG